MNRIASFANFPSYSGLCNSDVITLLLLNWTVTYYVVNWKMFKLND